ncbi:MAG: hypothetical protein WAU32_04345 [Thermoanaerobaculia bacterium]
MPEAQRRAAASASPPSPRARIVAERFARFRTPQTAAYFDALAEHFCSLQADTFNYLDFDGYVRVFAACGLALELLPETFEGVTEPGLVAWRAVLRAGREEGLESVPPEQRSLVSGRLGAYLASVESVPPGWRRLRDYGAGFWRALARPSA